MPVPTGRDPKGRWVRANPGPLGLGLHTEADRENRLPEVYRVLRRDLDTFVNGCVSDEADEPANIPTRRRALLEYRARVHRRILQVDFALEVRGVFDRRGKLREKWLTKLESLINVARGLDHLLGLERKARDVGTLSLADYLAHEEAREATAVEPDGPPPEEVP